MIESGIVSGYTVPSIFRALMSGRASGVLLCAGEAFEKKITFWHGKVVAASSNLIDDRMGEIVFRRGAISLDKFIEAAEKVNQKTRFGEALIRSGVFTELDLWDALNMQAREIVASLCYYSALQVRFEASQTQPRSEMALQFDCDETVKKAIFDAERTKKFWKVCEEKQILQLDPLSIAGADCDFLRDVVGILEKNSNFGEVVGKESRLSPIYTVRALFELYSRGVLKENLGFTQHFVSERSAELLNSVVEHGNFMFAELKSCVESEVDWSSATAAVNRLLNRHLGYGAFVQTESGFHSANILRACVFQQNCAQWAATSASANCWLDVVPAALSDILYEGILLIVFELQNRRIESEAFTQARKMIDRMRFSDISMFS